MGATNTFIMEETANSFSVSFIPSGSGGEDLSGSMAEAASEERDTEFLTMTNCSTEFEDGTTCDCGFCNGGAGMEGTDGAGAGISSLGAGVTQTHRSLGFDLRCSNNMVSLECTRVDSGAVEFCRNGWGEWRDWESCPPR